MDINMHVYVEPLFSLRGKDADNLERRYACIFLFMKLAFNEMRASRHKAVNDLKAEKINKLVNQKVSETNGKKDLRRDRSAYVCSILDDPSTSIIISIKYRQRSTQHLIELEPPSPTVEIGSLR